MVGGRVFWQSSSGVCDGCVGFFLPCCQSSYLMGFLVSELLLLLPLLLGWL